MWAWKAVSSYLILGNDARISQIIAGLSSAFKVDSLLACLNDGFLIFLTKCFVTIRCFELKFDDFELFDFRAMKIYE